MISFDFDILPTVLDARQGLIPAPSLLAAFCRLFPPEEELH